MINQIIGNMFKPGKMRKAPDREPTYLYRKISVPAGPDNSQLKNIKDTSSIDGFYKQLRDSGFKSDKPKEGVQVFKVKGPVDSSDYTKHIQGSEKLYRTLGDEEGGQIRAQTVILYPKGKDGGESISYLKITGGNKLDPYYKTVNSPLDLDEVLK
jgi:hypothetical protein